MLAGIAVALDDPEPRPPAPTAPSVHLIGGRSTSLPAWPVRIPTLSPCDIAASMSLARAVGESERLHHGWLPQRPAAAAVPAIPKQNASTVARAASRNCMRVFVTLVARSRPWRRMVNRGRPGAVRVPGTGLRSGTASHTVL